MSAKRWNPDRPICQHLPMITRVSCHEHLGEPECVAKANASTWTCGEAGCVERGKRWVKEKTGFEPVVLTYPVHVPRTTEADMTDPTPGLLDEATETTTHTEPVDVHICPACETPTQYAMFSGGREWYCPTCDDNGVYPDAAPRLCPAYGDFGHLSVRCELPDGHMGKHSGSLDWA